MLPEDFRYAGVMSFAGAIYSRKGTVRYARSQGLECLNLAPYDYKLP